MGCISARAARTSSLVYPAAGLVEVARENGAVTVEINPEPTMRAATFDFVLADTSGSVLPELLESLAANPTR